MRAFEQSNHHVFNRKYISNHKSTSDFLKEAKGKNLNPEKLEVYELLCQWRERYGTIWDGNPRQEIVSIQNIIKLANASPRSTAAIVNLIGVGGNMPQFIAGQEQTILKIIEEGREFMQRVN